MSLSTLAVVLGLGVALPAAFATLKPKQCMDALRRFPRSQLWGFVLMPLGTLWFLWNLKQDDISDFAAFKPIMFLGFAAIGFGTCAFVRDFLAVRGLAVVMLLLSNVMLNTARWVDTEWRLVIAVWAYVWIVLGVWFTISPWRLRDLIGWATEIQERFRLLSAVKLAFGAFVLVLALTAFRSAQGG